MSFWNPTELEKQASVQKAFTEYIRVVRFGSCEYLTWGVWNSGIAHKGDCSNPIHKKP